MSLHVMLNEQESMYEWSSLVIWNWPASVLAALKLQNVNKEYLYAMEPNLSYVSQDSAVDLLDNYNKQFEEARVRVIKALKVSLLRSRGCKYLLN